MNRPAPYSKQPHPDEVRKPLADRTRLTAQDLRDLPGIIARARERGLIRFPNSVMEAEMLDNLHTLMVSACN